MPVQRHDDRGPVPQKPGKRSVDYPKAHKSYPRIAEGRSAAKTGTDRMLAFAAAHPDTSSFPSALKTREITDKGDDTDKNATEIFETLPGASLAGQQTGEFGIETTAAQPVQTGTAAESGILIKQSSVAPTSAVEAQKQTVNYPSDLLDVVLFGGAPDNQTGIPIATEKQIVAAGTLPSTTSTTGVDHVTITAGGSWTVAPTVVFTPVSGGSGAAGIAVLNPAGGIGYVRLTASGTAYLAAPTVSFTGGTGSGATATATIGQRFIEIQPQDRWRSIQIASRIVDDPVLYNEDIFCFKTYPFPDVLLAILFYNEAGTSDDYGINAIGYSFTYSGEVAFKIQNGSRNPCAARRKRFFTKGQPTAVYTPTIIIPSTGSVTIQGGGFSARRTTDGISESSSISYRSATIPPVLTGVYSSTAGAGSFVGGASASATVDLPDSYPLLLTQGDIIRVVEEAERWRLGVYVQTVFDITIPYTSGAAPV